MDKLTEALEFLRQTTIDKALAHPDIDSKAKNIIAHTNRLIGHFNRVGDLVRYIDTFKPVEGKPSHVQIAIRSIGLPTIDDLHDEFMARFGEFEGDRTRLTDFVVGKTYSSWEVILFAEKYNPRVGGILPIGPDDAPTAVFIKASFDGTGPYPNEWIQPGVELKYYLMSFKDVFNPEYKVNQAIINSGDNPIYVFDKKGTDCKLVGLFHYKEYVTETNGDMWFRLVKRDAFDHTNPTTTEELHKDLERKVRKSQSDTKGARVGRLEKAPKKPKVRYTITTSFERNPDVIADVLERAKGICERCNKQAPFIRKKDNTPYLEVHHIVTLAEDGDDTVENAKALCPNCHRELHFGIEAGD